jgi:predicted O-methyltransferase YrrM
MAEPQGGNSDEVAGSRRALSLFLLGFLTLFLELVLIRFLAGNIWNLGFFPNIVLMGTFVGMGTGFVSHHFLAPRTSRVVFGAAPVVLLVLTLFVTFMHPGVPGFGPDSGLVGGEVFYTATQDSVAEAGYPAFALWLILIIAVFAMLSQYTAKLFARFAPLRAYTLEIGGSCVGILTFMLMSALQLPASLWFLLMIPLAALAPTVFSVRQTGLATLCLCACAGLSTFQDTRLLSDPEFAGDLEVTWSPYQKVELALPASKDPFIFVNGIGHQGMHTSEVIAKLFYQSPYDYREQRGQRPYERVLIIGAGGGNDVAAALANGASHVDAVEIDPVIARAGKSRHPAHPYDDPRVSLHVGDGRAFLTNTDEHYDLILFALTDSLVKVSPMAQLRLENYLFTTESFRRAFERLAPDGVLVLYNFYREPWVVDKLDQALRQATGHEPERLATWHSAFAVVALPRQGAAPAGPSAASVDIATDDWPFPYLRVRSVPVVYRWAMFAILAYVTLLFVAIQRTGLGRGSAAWQRGAIPTKLAFALMGAAFLLLETKSIIQFSLLFGTTWLNNSLVFLGVLILVLAANWTAQAVRGRWIVWITFPLLLVSCLVTFVYPLSNLLYVENDVLRFAVASLLTFSPVFFANLLFSLEFRDRVEAEHLFGWNLLGSTVGGVLEYTSMALGYGALAGLVALFYVGAMALFALGARRQSGLS